MTMDLWSPSSTTTTIVPVSANASTPGQPPFGPTPTAVIAFLAGLMALLTAGGNVLVMLSFKVDKQLRTITNYFLLSLAVADLMIGLVSMPLFTLLTLYGSWPLGTIVCDCWLAMDYLMSNASVLNLLIISFDRYLSITRPLTYRARRTTQRAIWMIAAAWLFSLALWPPWIFAWPAIDGERKVPAHECYIQFLSSNKYVTVTTAVAAFYLPATVMTILYVKIFHETEKRQRDLEHLTADRRQPQLISQKSTSSSDEPGQLTLSPTNPSLRKSSSLVIPSNFGTELPRPLWRRICHCCKIDRDPVEYLEDDSTDDMGDTAETITSSRPGGPSNSILVNSGSNNRIKTTDKTSAVKNGTLAPLLTCSSGVPPSPRPPSTMDESETYTILITFPPSGGVASSTSVPTIEEIYLDEEERVFNVASRSRVSSTAASSGGGSPAERRPTNQRVTQPSNAVLNMTLQQAQTSNKTAARTKQNINLYKKRRVEKKQDKKAAKTLSAILFAFIITWTPYNVFVLANAFSKDIIPPHLFGISYYLCYLNSTVNPICYALCNANFRKTYTRILCCRKNQNTKNSAAYS